MLVSFDLTLSVCVCKFSVCDQPLVLPPSLKDSVLDFGVCSATHTSSIIFVVVNSNPIEVRDTDTTSCVRSYCDSQLLLV